MVTIYCDGADIATMTKYAIDPVVGGFTTNPSLMKKSGIKNYRDFAQAVLSAIGDKPVSFEVLADDWDEMETQAHEIASWGENVWVKIPIMNTKGESSIDLIDKLQDLRLNITAVMTLEQLALLRRRPITPYCFRIRRKNRRYRAKSLGHCSQSFRRKG